MTSKHTPGPWAKRDVVRRYENGTTELMASEVVQGAYRIAEVNDPCDQSIIAAAPDMLTALRLAEGRLALLLRQYPDQSETCDHPTATRYVLDKVTAAIAKATEPTT